jgi:hypothetical protein
MTPTLTYLLPALTAVLVISLSLLPSRPCQPRRRKATIVAGARR